MKTFYRRRLPHLQPPGGTFFVTYRLYGSIPVDIIQRIRAEYRAEMVRIREEADREFGKNRGVELRSANTDRNLKAERSSAERAEQRSAALRKQLAALLKKKRYEAQKRQFKSWDDFLDSNLNAPYHLRDKAVAQLNSDAIKFYDGKRYQLYTFCIMSNHIHLMFRLLPDSPPLWKVMQDLKKYTALNSNRLIGQRDVPFWDEESYDHLVREKEFNRILAYILNNPVKAGLVKDWRDWPWTYCSTDLLEV